MEKENRRMTCIVCPVGCAMEVTIEDGQVADVDGNECKKGVTYAQEEVVAPTRTLASTVMVQGGVFPLVPVRTASEVPKGKIEEIMEVLSTVELEAPVQLGQVVVPNAVDTGVDVVATRSIRAGKRAVG